MVARATSASGGAVPTFGSPVQRTSKFRNKSRSKTQDAMDNYSIIYTTGELFSDGTSIDLLQDAQTGRLRLLVFDGKRCRIAPEIQFRGSVYQPAHLNDSIMQAMRLPSECGPFEKTGELFTAVQELFTGHGFPKDVALPTTYFGFASWFARFLPAAPCLLIAGPRPEVVLFLELLSAVVRHPLPLGDVTRSGLCSLPIHLQPTLLIDQQRISRSTWGLLLSSNHHTANIPRKDGLVNIFCAKAVFCEDMVYAANIGDGTFKINIPPSRGRLPILMAPDKNKITSAFQSRFLAYRLRNICKVRDSQCDFPEFDSRVRILGRVLGAPIVDAPEHQANLGLLLRNYQEGIRASKSLDLRCVVIEALLVHCHEKSEEKLHVGELTKTVNLIMKGRGQTTESTPESIGAILRDHNFCPKRDRQGYAILLNGGNPRYVHQLARTYDVAAAQGIPEKCLHCAEMLADVDTRSPYNSSQSRKNRVGPSSA